MRMRFLYTITALVAALLFAPTTVLKSQGDLFVENFTVLPLVVRAGSTFDIYGTIRYTGGFSTPMPATFELFLKKSGEPLSPAQSMGEVAIYNFSGAANDFPLQYTTISVPSTLRNGWYDIHLYTDAYGEIDETDETNNLVVDRILVYNSQRPAATCNLYPRHTWVAGGTACINENQIRCGGRVANRPASNGLPVTEASPRSVLFMYISEDNAFSPDDYLVGDARMDPIQPGALDGPTQLANPYIADMPTDITPGFYYMLWYTDVFDYAFETDETDNLASKPVYIRTCGRNRDQAGEQLFEVTILAENDLSCFPNPVADNVQVKYPATGEEAAELALISTDGRLVSTQTLSAGEQSGLTEFNTTDLASGTYFVVYTSGDTKLTQLLIKE